MGGELRPSCREGPRNDSRARRTRDIYPARCAQVLSTACGYPQVPAPPRATKECHPAECERCRMFAGLYSRKHSRRERRHERTLNEIVRLVQLDCPIRSISKMLLGEERENP